MFAHHDFGHKAPMYINVEFVPPVVMLATLSLKGRYTFSNCQRPVFSLGVSHHNHKITNMVEILAQSVIKVARKL